MFTSIARYLRETRDELLNKVSWPSWDELLESTSIVVVATIIISMIIWLMDFGLGKLVDLVF